MLIAMGHEACAARMARSDATSSLRFVTVDWSVSLSPVRSSTLDWRFASHAFLRWRHLRAAGKGGVVRTERGGTRKESRKRRTLTVPFEEVLALLLLGLVRVVRLRTHAPFVPGVVHVVKVVLDLLS